MKISHHFFAHLRFWFSWEGGVIRCGSGSAIGSNVLIEYTDPFALTISQLSYQASAGISFEIPTTVGKCSNK